jgi:hypothetical protein
MGVYEFLSGYGERVNVARGHASAGLLSYRCKGRYGTILIGAKTDAEAWSEAKRSTDTPHDMEVLSDGVWMPVARGN